VREDCITRRLPFLDLDDFGLCYSMDDNDLV
jgi:hypothetical protein